MKRKPSWLAIAAVALTITCLAVIGFGVFGYIRLNGRINDLDSSIRAIANQTSQSTSSDLQAAVDFMKDQMQHLIWLLGVIIAGAGVILAFFGMNTRKSVEEKYELTYSKLVAAKDTEVFKKQVIFLYKENDDSMIGFQNEIRARGYNTKWIRASISDVTSKLSDASIVVYHVNVANDPQYEDIADWCDSKGVHCILYCPGIRLSDEFMRKNLSYVSTSIQIAKLRESLYTLLYLAP